MRRRGFVALAAALLGWTVFAAALEIHRTRWIVANDPWEEPSRWRIHSRHVAELREFLQEARPHLPTGQAIGVVDDPAAPEASYFRYLWAAYLAPDLELRHAGAGDPRAGVRTWLAFGPPVEDPRFEILFEAEVGRVYRGPGG